MRIGGVGGVYVEHRPLGLVTPFHLTDTLNWLPVDTL